MCCPHTRTNTICSVFLSINPTTFIHRMTTLNTMRIEQIVTTAPSRPQQQCNFSLSLSSMPENVSLVEPFVEKVRSRYPINDEQYFNILVVLTEAVNNSILHGNQADPQKRVNVRLRASHRSFTFVVSDQGGGFDPAELLDPTAPEQVSIPNGRGVFLMQKLSDGLRFKDNGRRVNIRFKL